MSGATLADQGARHDRHAGEMLAVDGLHLTRRGDDMTPDFTLDVPRFRLAAGARLGIVGESGSGKTTLLQILGLLTWPDAVERFHFAPEGTGRDLTGILRRRDATTLSRIRAENIGFVLQDGALLPYLTVFENAWLAAELAGKATSARRRELHDLAALIGLGEHLSRKPATLSGGQRQRAAVLRGLATGPRLVLADEPTASLDGATSDTVMAALIDSADATGATLVIVSHDVDRLLARGFATMRATLAREERRVTARFVDGGPA